MERPFIVRFENQTSHHDFDVVIHHPDCKTATEWTYGYFDLLRIEYLNSDFDGNHTFRMRGK